jgi:hypothetical protein
MEIKLGGFRMHEGLHPTNPNLEERGVTVILFRQGSMLINNA